MRDPHRGHRPPRPNAPSARAAYAGMPKALLSFVNTSACPACGVGDALATAQGLSAWSRGVLGLTVGPMPPAARRHVLRFRRALQRIFLASSSGVNPPRYELSLLNRTALRSPERTVLAWRGGGWTVRAEGGSVISWDQLLGRLARGAVAVLAGTEGDRVRPCRGPGCQHFLFARTRTQLWCSAEGCGNRARVARHYLKERSEPIAAGGDSPSNSGRQVRSVSLSRERVRDGR